MWEKLTSRWEKEPINQPGIPCIFVVFNHKKIITMQTTDVLFQVPSKSEVSENNQAIFDNLEKKLSFVPNLYAYIAKNDTALGDYLAFQGRKSTLRAKEVEIVNLITSQINGCRYCQSAHTAIGKMNGFTDEQILEIRSGEATFDEKLNALARFTQSVVQFRGKVSRDEVIRFLDAGYLEANLIDVFMIIGEKTVSNLIHNVAQFDIDFPVAPEL